VASFNWIGKIAATNVKARFVAVRVRVVDGPPQRIMDKDQQHLPGEEVWLIGEHRMSGGEEILSRQPAGGRRPAHLGGYHQSAMDWDRRQGGSWRDLIGRIREIDI
jgi:hypothetical protein